MAKVAFIGLGVMGYPMAGHLAKAGHDVVVFNRTRAKAEKWMAEFGGNLADTPAEAARGRPFVFSCVGDDDSLRAVTCGREGAFATMCPGSVYVDHSTVSARVSRELHAEAKARQIDFIDAPISGGQAGAENGQLSIMCGGEKDAFDKALPLMESYARICRLLGPSGAGQLTKMVNQICIAGLLQALAEGLHFAEKAGLDGKAVLEVISQGAAGSWQMENRGPTMLDDRFDFGFAVDWMLKDLGICLDEAAQNGASLPVTAEVREYYKDIRKMGGGRWDTSSLIRRLRVFDNCPGGGAVDNLEGQG